MLVCFREMPGVGNLGDSEIYRDMGSGFGIFGLVFAVRVGLDLVSNGLSIKAQDSPMPLLHVNYYVVIGCLCKHRRW